MSKKLLGLVLTIMLVSMLMVPSTAMAQNDVPTSEKPEREVWIAPDGQLFFMETFSHEETSVKQNMLIQPLLGGCKALTNGVNMYNSFGDLVWSYSWKISWCYDGSKITSLTPLRIVNIYAAGYSFKGDISSTISGGVNQWSYNQYKQGDICYIDYGINCAWHTYPSVEQTVYGNGNSSGNAWY